MRTFIFVFLAVAQLCLAGDTIPLAKTDKSTPTKSTKDSQKTLEFFDELEEGQASKPYLASVDTFGSDRISEPVIRKFWGKELDAWLSKGMSGDDTALLDEKKLLKKIQTKFQFAFAEWSVMEYFENDTVAVHITLDVVEKDDVKKRMPFLKNPEKELKDPDGLIAKWDIYTKTALELVEKGELIPEADKCATAFHCPFGHTNAKLKGYEKTFTDGARKHQVALAEILSHDKRDTYRANAAFLLAYTTDAKRLASLMEERIKDSSEKVRNNVLRVLGDLAVSRPEVVIPVQPVADALYFPRTTDRSKAIYVLVNLLASSPSAKTDLDAHIPVLLKMLSSQQPDHSEPALTILKKLSGKEFAATDIKGWHEWYKQSHPAPTRTNANK